MISMMFVMSHHPVHLRRDDDDNYDSVSCSFLACPYVSRGPSCLFPGHLSRDIVLYSKTLVMLAFSSLHIVLFRVSQRGTLCIETLCTVPSFELIVGSTYSLVIEHS